MRKFLLVCLLATSVHVSFAQISCPASGSENSENCRTIQLHLGTQGIGFDYRQALSSTVGLRIGVSGVPKISIADSAAKYQNDIAGKMFNGHVLADFCPFGNGFLKSVRLVTGIAYMSLQGTYVRTPHDGSFRFGDIPLTKEETGYVKVTAESRGFATYAGVSAFDFLQGKPFCMNVDLGTYYLPRPRTILTGTGMMAGMNKQNRQLEENIRDYRWLPLIQLNFIYHL
jgi:hypothetical protein